MVRALALLAASAIFFSSIPGAPAVGPGGRAPSALVLQVELLPTGAILNHSFNDQTVTLDGTVIVEPVALVTVRVALSASTDLGWAASVEPETMSFVVSEAQYFNATVRVPAGTSNRTAILTVRGNATIMPGIQGDVDSDTATISVQVDPSGGNDTPPAIPRGKPASTGVFVPPIPLILGAVTLGAICFSGAVLWYWEKRPFGKRRRRKR